MNGNFSVNMRTIAELMEERGISKAGRVQFYIDSEVLRLTAAYLPFQQGALRNSDISGTVLGSGNVVYNTPYARYLYYGKVMVGRAPKTITDTPLSFNGAPMRGAFWFERMKVDHLDGILKGAQRTAGGK